MNRFIIVIVNVCCLSLLAGDACGQPAKDQAAANPVTVPISSRSNIRLDINSGSFLDQLPFDVPFRIIGLAYDQGLLQVSYDMKKGIHGKGEFAGRPQGVWEQRANQQIPFMLNVNVPLEPNSVYTFKFDIKRRLTDDELKILKQLAVDRLSAELNRRLNNQMKFELNKTDVDKVSDDIVSVLKATMQAKGLDVKQNSLKDDYYALLKDAMLDLTGLYESVHHTTLEQISGNKDFYDKEISMMKTVAGERGFVESKDYTQLLKSLNDLAVSIDPEQPLKKADLTKLLKATEVGLAALEGSPAAGSTLFKNEMPDIKNMLETVQHDLISYRDGEATAKPVIEEYATKLANILADIIYSDLIVSDDTVGSYEARATFYMSADIGVALFPTLGKGSPYLGTNIYLRPVNKQRPIYQGDYNPWRSFSILVGISFLSINQTNVRSDLFGSNLNLLAGAGYRITDHIRLNGGFVFYKDLAVNPLSNSSRLGVNGFCSLSFDYDINSAFKSLFQSSMPK